MNCMVSGSQAKSGIAVKTLWNHHHNNNKNKDTTKDNKNDNNDNKNAIL